ncbi:MAG: hypothetical protein ACO25T_02760 [Arenimonas sp.]|uniref:hypothetical protein n=1 Tax=Arenimonas sp. TaxID=1872635 RepID=UPI003C0E1FA4
MAKSLIYIGLMALLFAFAYLCLSLYESTIIPASQFKDHAVGYSLIRPLAVIGFLALGIGWALNRKPHD